MAEIDSGDECGDTRVGGRRADRSRRVPRGPCDTHVPLEPFLGGVHNNLPCADLWEIGGATFRKVTGKGGSRVT